ncbi:DnaJ protein [Pseudoscourfieldia marina]
MAAQSASRAAPPQRNLSLEESLEDLELSQSGGFSSVAPSLQNSESVPSSLDNSITKENDNHHEEDGNTAVSAAAALLRSAVEAGASLQYDVSRRNPTQRARIGRLRTRVASFVQDSVNTANGYEIQKAEPPPAPKPASRYASEWGAHASANNAQPPPPPAGEVPLRPPKHAYARRAQAQGTTSTDTTPVPTPRSDAPSVSPPSNNASDAPWEGVDLPPVNPAHWKGSLDAECPELLSCAPPELRKFLLQAGAPARGNVWTNLGALAEQARGWAPVWECRRVLACSTAEEVLRLPPGWDEVNASGVTKDGRRIAARYVTDDEREKRTRAAFRKVSMIVHPDKNASPSAPEAMAKVVQAQKAMRKAFASSQK